MGRLPWRYSWPVPLGANNGSDLAFDGVPWVTLGIIFVNAVVFLAKPWTMVDQFVSLPKRDTEGREIALSIFPAAFLHSGAAHMGFNL